MIIEQTYRNICEKLDLVQSNDLSFLIRGIILFGACELAIFLVCKKVYNHFLQIDQGHVSYWRRTSYCKKNPINAIDTSLELYTFNSTDNIIQTPNIKALDIAPINYMNRKGNQNSSNPVSGNSDDQAFCGICLQNYGM